MAGLGDKKGIVGLLLRAGLVRSTQQAIMVVLAFVLACTVLAGMYMFRVLNQSDPGGVGDRPPASTETYGNWYDVYTP